MSPGRGAIATIATDTATIAIAIAIAIANNQEAT